MGGARTGTGRHGKHAGFLERRQPVFGAGLQALGIAGLHFPAGRSPLCIDGTGHGFSHRSRQGMAAWIFSVGSGHATEAIIDAFGQGFGHAVRLALGKIKRYPEIRAAGAAALAGGGVVGVVCHGTLGRGVRSIRGQM